MEQCIFCNKDNITSGFVYEDESVMVFMDIEPINEGHVLVVPKAHYWDIEELPDELLDIFIYIFSRGIRKTVLAG